MNFYILKRKSELMKEEKNYYLRLFLYLSISFFLVYLISKQVAVFFPENIRTDFHTHVKANKLSILLPLGLSLIALSFLSGYYSDLISLSVTLILLFLQIVLFSSATIILMLYFRTDETPVFLSCLSLYCFYFFILYSIGLLPAHSIIDLTKYTLINWLAFFSIEHFLFHSYEYSIFNALIVFSFALNLFLNGGIIAEINKPGNEDKIVGKVEAVFGAFVTLLFFFAFLFSLGNRISARSNHDVV